jgi:chorismate--pyruvate lyase
LRSWLYDRGSLTRRLQERFGNTFQVQVLQQTHGLPSASERLALSIQPRQRATLREVMLYGAGQPRVYARSVIPFSTSRGQNRKLLRLGNRPLGAFLFASPFVRRGAIDLARIPLQQLPLSQPQQSSEGPAYTWGRRSLFFLHNSPLLVCEIFLPNLLDEADGGG